MDHRRRTYYSPRRRAALDAWLVSHPRDIAECAAAERPGAELTARANRDLAGSSGKMLGQRIRHLFTTGQLRVWDGRRRRPVPPDLPAGGLTPAQWLSLRAGVVYVLTLSPELLVVSDRALATVLQCRGYAHVSVAAIAELRRPVRPDGPLCLAALADGPAPESEGRTL